MKNIIEEKIKMMLDKSRKSCLWKYSNEIKRFRSRGVSFVEIKLWLVAEGTSVSIQNIRQFYIRNLKDRDLVSGDKNNTILYEKESKKSVFQHLIKDKK